MLLWGVTPSAEEAATCRDLCKAGERGRTSYWELKKSSEQERAGIRKKAIPSTRVLEAGLAIPGERSDGRGMDALFDTQGLPAPMAFPGWCIIGPNTHPLKGPFGGKGFLAWEVTLTGRITSLCLTRPRL